MLYTNDKCNVISDKILATIIKYINIQCSESSKPFLVIPSEQFSFQFLLQNISEPKGLRGVSEMGGYHPTVGPDPIPIAPRLPWTVYE